MILKSRSGISAAALVVWCHCQTIVKCSAHACACRYLCRLIKNKSTKLGTEPITKLLFAQAAPASVGILVMSLNILVDTIFVGNWIGSNAIAAINVVLPVSFFIAALGMAVGIGGSSIVSRALGASDLSLARRTVANQVLLTLCITVTMVVLGLTFQDQLVVAFGGKGDIFDYASTYYRIVLYGVPVLALSMMGNTIIRAEGAPRHAMIAMIIPSVTNLIMDYVLINKLGMGMEGAAWATTTSYVFCFSYIAYYFIRFSSLMPLLRELRFNISVLAEIGSLGGVTLARQAVVSVIYLIMNNILFDLDGEAGVAVFAIVGRMLMFALFPVFGVTQGFLPIAGYNYGAAQYERVREVINKAMLWASIIATLIFIGIFSFPRQIANLFVDDPQVLNLAPTALRYVFMATPIIAVQLIGAAYFQAIGKAVPAFFLTLSRQGFIFIPLVLILPKFFGTLGVWLSFPIADASSSLITFLYLRYSLKRDAAMNNATLELPKQAA